MRGECAQRPTELERLEEGAVARRGEKPNAMVGDAGPRTGVEVARSPRVEVNPSPGVTAIGLVAAGR